MLTRTEIMHMSDTALRCAYDRVSACIDHDWHRGQPGSLTDVYDLALLRLEADLRALPLSPVRLPGQLSLPH